MSHALMEGMLWAALLLVAVPLLIGLAVLVILLRRRNRENGGDVPAV